MREALDYARQRLLDLRLVLLSALLVTLARFAAPGLPAGDVAGQVLVAALSVAGFRIWDDLTDLPHDSLHHAERILVRSGRPSSYGVASLLLLACATALAWLLFGEASAAALGIAAAALGLAYRLPRTPLRLSACLAKYAAIVLAIVPEGTLAEHPARLLLAAGAAWAAVAANDLTDWIRQAQRRPT
jgi:4-hydroxybenzoate polyprenyltransferase